MKQAKNPDIEARVKDAFTYVKPYIKKVDVRTDIKALHSRYENVTMKEKYVSKTKCKIATIQYRNEISMNFENFVSKLVNTTDDI